MNVDDLKNLNYLICVKTHMYKEELEYLQGIKYKCKFEEGKNYNCIYIEYPDGSGWRKMLLSDNDIVIEYCRNHFMTKSEYRKYIINELL